MSLYSGSAWVLRVITFLASAKERAADVGARERKWKWSMMRSNNEKSVRDQVLVIE